jgi:hypothetical protein
MINTNSQSVHQLASQPTRSECKDYGDEGQGKNGFARMRRFGPTKKPTCNKQHHYGKVSDSVPKPDRLRSRRRRNCPPIDSPQQRRPILR